MSRYLVRMAEQGMVEEITKGIASINTDHKYIHAGIAFIANLNVGTLGDSATESFSFKTPENHYVHLKDLELRGTGSNVKLDFMFGTTANPLTINSAGETATELTGPHNANLVSTNTTGVEIKKTPTYTDSETGEVLDTIEVLGTATNQSITADSASRSVNFEYVLKPNTYYVLKFTNESSATASSVKLFMFWYEEGQGLGNTEDI